MNIIAIIPARAGSKRIPHKNTKILGDKPLIAHTIETAIAAGCFKRVIVSTECSHIASVAEQYGAVVPWLRTESLASDEALVSDVVLEILHKLIKEGEANIDGIMLLQPTSPFRTIQNIQDAITLFEQVSPESVISVSPTQTHPFWCKTVDVDGVMQPFCMDQQSSVRYQDLPPVYQLNGLIYLTHIKNLLERQSFYSPQTRALIIPYSEETLDIDNPMDWSIAETILERKNHE